MRSPLNIFLGEKPKIALLFVQKPNTSPVLPKKNH